MTNEALNAQMFEETINMLGQQNMVLHRQVAQLTAHTAALLHKLKEVPSNEVTTTKDDVVAILGLQRQQLLRINAQMFQGTIHVMVAQNKELLQKISEFCNEQALEETLRVLMQIQQIKD